MKDDAMGSTSSPDGRSSRVSVGAAFPDLTIDELDPSLNVDLCFILIRGKDADGDTIWAFRSTGTLNLEELLGVLVVQTELLRKKLVSYWEE